MYGVLYTLHDSMLSIIHVLLFYFLTMLCLLYYGCCGDTPYTSSYHLLYYLSHRYELSQLKDACVKYITANASMIAKKCIEKGQNYEG